MVTRWYRPPEIIVAEPSYDTKIDIWSIGCIFFELAYIWDNQENDPNKRFPFQGSSCHPLSPIKSKNESH
jgi:serine/threonine protein kinase